MNSLNLLSSRVIRPSPLGNRPRSKSHGEGLQSASDEELPRGRSYSDENIPPSNFTNESESDTQRSAFGDDTNLTSEKDYEKAHLLSRGQKDTASYFSSLKYLVKKITDALTALLATIGAPIVYIASSFKDDLGGFSLLVPFKRRRRRRGTAEAPKDASLRHGDALSEKPKNRLLRGTKLRHSYSSDSLSSMASDSDSEKPKSPKDKLVASVHSHHRRRSSRIRLRENDDVTKRQELRTSRGDVAGDAVSSGTDLEVAPLTVDNIKSPISNSTASKLRYPHAPRPPRPLVPRRQPSYSTFANSIARSPNRSPVHPSQRKTLVLDLDETLIHSLAKGGRMSSGHMVEVKLNAPVAYSPVTQAGPHQAPPPTVIGPHHPILYYVHKRPHCDEFLRKVCKWYKLVVFTASVQEYADPVVDWLEQEREYFAGRYYRQHCTFRNGAYIKDLSSIEPDLSKVIILDNSPVSYIFHEDNAVPIEGWINDPTDNDLLHLIPMLEALQYVTDVRALLALRRGEADAATSA